jgi:hypothetical protein
MSNSKHAQPAGTTLPYSPDYPPPDFIDPVIEAYKNDVDLAAVRENLKLTVEERIIKAQARALERATSLSRLSELDEFYLFTSRLLDRTAAPHTIEEYLRLWRDQKSHEVAT